MLDAETGSTSRDGETMVDWHSINTIMKGYLKNPEATEQALSKGYFRSGDLAVMHPNGYVEIKDRLKILSFQAVRIFLRLKLKACCIAMMRWPLLQWSPDDNGGSARALLNLSQG